MGKLFIFYLVVLTFNVALSQSPLSSPSPPNLRDAKGHRIGKWLITYTAQMKPTHLADSIAIYRIVNFDWSGNIVGTVYDLDRFGRKIWEGELLALDPVDIKHGYSSWYYYNGQIARSGVFVGGKEEGWFTEWSEQGQVSARIPYRNGIVEGVFTTWKSASDSAKFYLEAGKYVGWITLIREAADLISQGHLQQALPVAEKAARIADLTMAKKDTVYAAMLLNLAFIYRETGQFDKAISVYSGVLGFLEKDDAIYLNTLADFGVLYKNKYHYDRAISMFRQAIALGDSLRGDHSEAYASSLNNLAMIYQTTNQFNLALPLYLKILAIREKSPNLQNAEYMTILHNLATLYEALGQTTKSFPLYEKALAICVSIRGKKHMDYAKIQLNLGEMYTKNGFYVKATESFAEAFIFLNETMDKTSTEYATALLKLAHLCGRIEEYDKALMLSKQACEIYQHNLGIEHPAFASALGDLASAHEFKGQFSEAFPLNAMALLILRKNKTHHSYGVITQNLISLFKKTGDTTGAAIPLILDAHGQYREQLLQNITILDEVGLRQFQKSFDFSSLAYSVGYSLPADSLVGILYDNILINKGLGLLATQKLNKLLRQSSDTVTASLANQLRALKQDLARRYTAAHFVQQEIDSLEYKAKQLNQMLIIRIPEYKQAFEALRIEWPQVQKGLKENEAAVEFVSFPYFNKNRTDSVLYIALLIRPGWSSPKLVYLSEQRQLEKLLSPYQSQSSKTYANHLYIKQKSKKSGTNLYDLVWEPLDSLMAGAKTIYYSSSGLLHRINLGALSVGNDQRLGDKYQLVSLSSTRQLGLTPDPVSQNSSVLLIGNIDYGKDSFAKFDGSGNRSEATAVIGREGTLPEIAAWKPLENTGLEIEEIGRLLKKQNFQVKAISGKDASEEGYYSAIDSQTGSPRILHIATHGFFYESPAGTLMDHNKNGIESGTTFQNSQEAFIRSGLVLARANKAWQGLKIPEDQQDGILTAYEISLSDLQKTELVVLSACETGLGDIHNSEGVYGLQRAFKMAGVDKIIMSLWKVPDSATRALVTRFYEYYLAKVSKRSVGRAFDLAVRDLRDRYPEPYFWAGFVMIE